MQTFSEHLQRKQICKKSTQISTFNTILKFNPYHDSRGRFTGPGSATSFTYAPGKSRAHDLAIEREKKRTAAAAATPEQKRAAALKTVEDKIRKQNYESAAIIGKNGEQLLFKDGEKSQVQFTREEALLMKGATLTHNHPSSSCFSYADVKTFVYRDMQEIRAVGNNGNTHILRRTTEVDNKPFELRSVDYEKENKFVDAYAKKYNNAVRKAQAGLDKMGFREKVLSGEVTQEQANTEMRKLISTDMSKYLTRYAKNYGFEYAMEGEA